MSREDLAPVWRGASGAEVWESPIYEQFLPAVREVNMGLLREQRIRVLGGDSPIRIEDFAKRGRLAFQEIPSRERGPFRAVDHDVGRLAAESENLSSPLDALGAEGPNRPERPGGYLLANSPGKPPPTLVQWPAP